MSLHPALSRFDRALGFTDPSRYFTVGFPTRYDACRGTQTDVFNQLTGGGSNLLGCTVVNLSEMDGLQIHDAMGYPSEMPSPETIHIDVDAHHRVDIERQRIRCPRMYAIERVRRVLTGENLDTVDDQGERAFGVLTHVLGHPERVEVFAIHLDHLDRWLPVVITSHIIIGERDLFEFVLACDYVQWAAWICQRVLCFLDRNIEPQLRTQPPQDPNTIPGLRPMGNMGYEQPLDARLRQLCPTKPHQPPTPPSQYIKMGVREAGAPYIDAYRDMFDPDYRYCPFAAFFDVKSPSQVKGEMTENQHFRESAKPFLSVAASATEQQLKQLTQQHSKDNPQDAWLYRLCRDQILWERRAKHTDTFCINELEINKDQHTVPGTKPTPISVRSNTMHHKYPNIPADLNHYEHFIELLNGAVTHGKSPQMVVNYGGQNYPGIFTPIRTSPQHNTILVEGQFSVHGRTEPLTVDMLDYIDACFACKIFTRNAPSQPSVVDPSGFAHTMSPRAAIKPPAAATTFRDPLDECIEMSLAKAQGRTSPPPATSPPPTPSRNPFDDLGEFKGYDTQINSIDAENEELRDYVLKGAWKFPNGEMFTHDNGAPSYYEPLEIFQLGMRVNVREVDADIDQLVALSATEDGKLVLILSDGRYATMDLPESDQHKVLVSKRYSTHIYNNRSRMWYEKLKEKTQSTPAAQPAKKPTPWEAEMMAEMYKVTPKKPAPSTSVREAAPTVTTQPPAGPIKKLDINAMLTASGPVVSAPRTPEPQVREEVKRGPEPKTPQPATDIEEVEEVEDNLLFEVDRSGEAELVVKTGREDLLIIGGVMVDISDYRKAVERCQHDAVVSNLAGDIIQKSFDRMLSGDFDQLCKRDEVSDALVEAVAKLFGSKSAVAVFPWFYRVTSATTFDVDAVQTAKTYFTMLAGLGSNVRQAHPDIKPNLLQVAMAHYDFVCGKGDPIEQVVKREQASRAFVQELAKSVSEQQPCVLVKPTKTALIYDGTPIYEDQVVAQATLATRLFRWIARSPEKQQDLGDIYTYLCRVVLGGVKSIGRFVQEGVPGKEGYRAHEWFFENSDEYVQHDLYDFLIAMIRRHDARLASLLYKYLEQDEFTKEMVEQKIVKVFSATEYADEHEILKQDYLNEERFAVKNTGSKTSDAISSDSSPLSKGQKIKAMALRHRTTGVVSSFPRPTLAKVTKEENNHEFDGDAFVLKLATSDDLDRQLREFFPVVDVQSDLSVKPAGEDFFVEALPEVNSVLREVSDDGQVSLTEIEDDGVQLWAPNALTLDDVVSTPNYVEETPIAPHHVQLFDGKMTSTAFMAIPQAIFQCDSQEGSVKRVLSDITAFIHREKPMHMIEVVDFMRTMAISSLAAGGEEGIPVRDPLAIMRAAQIVTQEINRYIKRVAGFPQFYLASILTATKEDFDELTDDTNVVSSDSLLAVSNLSHRMQVTEQGELGGDDIEAYHEYMSDVELRVSLPVGLATCGVCGISEHAKILDRDQCEPIMSTLVGALDFYFTGMAPEYAHVPTRLYLKDGAILEMNRRGDHWVICKIK